MRRGLVLIGIAVSLAGAGCGDDDDGGEGGAKPAAKPAAAASSIECLSLSTLSPEVHESATDADRSIRPLITSGAKAATILTGQLGAVVIEYPDAAAAVVAVRQARESKALAKDVEPSQIDAIDKTLFIDYSEEPHVRKVVQACASDPDQPPPTP